jgi:hypothetical protein
MIYRVRFPAVEIFLFSTTSRRTQGPTQPPIEGVPVALGDKAAED